MSGARKKWKCSDCQYENFATVGTCAMCDTPKDGGDSSAADSVTQGRGTSAAEDDGFDFEQPKASKPALKMSIKPATSPADSSAAVKVKVAAPLPPAGKSKKTDGGDWDVFNGGVHNRIFLLL